MSVYSLEEPMSLVNTSRRQSSSRAQLQSQRDDTLMESWDSLTKFNQCQRGRISNMSFEGDIFDEFLQRQGRGPPTVPVHPPTAPRSPFSSSSAQGALCEGLDDDASMEREEEFEIPVLPQGQRLVISILSTWGDRHYVGLNGLEVFSSSGEPLRPAHIHADPPDINILPAYGKDPRVVTNLIDGVNRTQDDMHLWLAPFTPGCSHTIYLDFGGPFKVAMIRVWNYNKSRIHSFRGVKDVEMLLDGRCIFRGEIAKASGTLSGGIWRVSQVFVLLCCYFWSTFHFSLLCCHFRVGPVWRHYSVHHWWWDPGGHVLLWWNLPYWNWGSWEPGVWGGAAETTYCWWRGRRETLHTGWFPRRRPDCKYSPKL